MSTFGIFGRQKDLGECRADGRIEHVNAELMKSAYFDPNCFDIVLGRFAHSSRHSNTQFAGGYVVRSHFSIDTIIYEIFCETCCLVEFASKDARKYGAV